MLFALCRDFFEHLLNVGHKHVSSALSVSFCVLLLTACGGDDSVSSSSGGGDSNNGNTVLSATDAQAIITQRCTVCHSVTPNVPAGGSAPGAGVVFDTLAQIRARATRMRARIDATTMPPNGNITNMTNTERVNITRWFDAGTPD